MLENDIESSSVMECNRKLYRKDTDMKSKLGLIGYGGMGKWHAENATRAGVEIAAVCDIDEVKQ